MHFSTLELPCSSNRAERGRKRGGEGEICKLTVLWQTTPAMQSVAVLTHHTFQEPLLSSDTTSHTHPTSPLSLSYLMEFHQSHVSGGRDGLQRGGHCVLPTVPRLTFGPQLPGPRTRLQNCIHSTAEIWDWRQRGVWLIYHVTCHMTHCQPMY